MFAIQAETLNSTKFIVDPTWLSKRNIDIAGNLNRKDFNPYENGFVLISI